MGLLASVLQVDEPDKYRKEKIRASGDANE